MNDIFVVDNGDRRSGIERREFTYAFHIPERRSGEDRRSGFDRRIEVSECQADIERRQIFLLPVL